MLTSLAMLKFIMPRGTMLNRDDDLIRDNFCDGHDVFCNTLTDPEWATLAEGADGNMRVYHVSEAMNPHSEYGPVPMDVSDWLLAVNQGIY
mmetsp:Transcript_45515/g.106922  ORF Transcript_45515/g.106922 Transcript_45515/m.106922 type:complete len:91 (-) Transcript_45515:80-352(-)